MQVYSNSKQDHLKTFLLLLFILVLAYLPVSSFLFFLKNDAFNGYFPPKFFMSESIHAGQLPLWNPYINFGIPQYGDMSSGYWSPITWLIASTAGYNAYTLTLEVLFYILAGGFGFYTMMGVWVKDKRIKMIAAVAFMCCGYQVGHLQHFNWLSGAAFLPWCLWSYILLLKKFSVRRSLICTVFFYLLIASAHPGITISAFYFFAAVFVFHFFNNKEKRTVKERISSSAKTHAFFLTVLLLISAGMIYGYTDLLPHFVRSEKISLESSLSNPTNLQSWISILLPFSTVKHNAFFDTDISMRNAYFGLDLLLFFLLACFQKKSSWQKFFLVAGCLFMLLSAGGIFKTIAYKFIPFIGYVRLNGEFRIFTILGFIIVAAIALEEFLAQSNKFSGRIKWIYYTMEILLFACIFFGIIKAIGNKESFLYSRQAIFSQAGFSSKLKALVDAVSFYDTFWIQGCIQLFFLWGIKYCLRSSNINLLKKLAISNMIIACLLNIPYTGVGKASVAQVQAVLNKSPEGIPIPVLQPINSNDSLSTEEMGLVGDWSMYNKQIGTKKEVPYPIALKETALYFKNNETDTAANFLDQPFLFISPGSTNSKVSINSFSSASIDISVTAATGSELILQQSFYPHWFYQNETEKKEVRKAGTAFMSAPVVRPAGKIHFSFEPVFLQWMMLLSAVSFITAIVLIFLLKPTPLSPSLQRQ